MTDPTQSQFVPSSPSALRDARWLTGGIWAALLLALVVTSGYGITAFAQGSLSSRYIGLPLTGPADPNAKVGAVVGIVLSVATALLILAAWRSFAKATNSLVTALSEASDAPEELPTAADWLAEPQSQPLISIAGEVVQFLGGAWAVMVVTPAVLGVTTAFS
jgi:hypothetical protein